MLECTDVRGHASHKRTAGPKGGSLEKCVKFGPDYPGMSAVNWVRNDGMKLGLEEPSAMVPGVVKRLLRLGHRQGPTPFSGREHSTTVQQAEIAVEDELQNKAVIRVFLVHFGQNPILPADVPGSDVIVETMASDVLVMQVIRSMTEPHFWENLIAGPAKTILSSYFHDTDQLKVLQVWSRRWKANNKPCAPRESESFSMLVRIQQSDKGEWMKRSGSGPTPIFTSIKMFNDGSVNDDGNRIIWVGKSIHETVATLTQVPDHLGIVYRHPGSYGIRFDGKRFPSAWKELKKTEDLPNLIQAKQKFIINGVPPTVSGASLETWGKELGWPIRTLKRLPDNRFLVGAAENPPAFHLQIGSSPAIVTVYENRMPKQAPQVLLGKLQMPTANLAADGKGEDTIFSDDPWGQFRAANGLPSSKTFGAAGNKSNETKEAPKEDATTSVITKQSERLSEVEDEIKQIKAQMAQDQSATQQRFGQMDQTINNMGNQLKSSLEEALKQQSSSLVKTFEALLKQSPREGGGRPSRSRSPVHKEL
eukprot:Skav229512  [mRNA]  locus=scaffold842:79891:90185:- [translate_table: standard]